MARLLEDVSVEVGELGANGAHPDHAEDRDLRADRDGVARGGFLLPGAGEPNFKAGGIWLE